ncbi:hypothetical protein B296_00022864 [Ensete ventricosum]|uniref:Uncharacterized protein n=1 Tax=Ensete ventricosum TaxID=4639 RepID=A0A426Z3D9_ENSVE|nr:hypothetical protein B296_00022864 [Ensete ventricosum]
MTLGSKGLGSSVGRGSSFDLERSSGGDSRWSLMLKMLWPKAIARKTAPSTRRLPQLERMVSQFAGSQRLPPVEEKSGRRRCRCRLALYWEGEIMGSLLFTERKRETLDRRLGTTGRFNDCREDPTTAEKIDIDLVLVLVQHNDSRSGNEEEPSLRVGEKG